MLSEEGFVIALPESSVPTESRAQPTKAAMADLGALLG